jgi:hypothetical protein
MNLKNAERMCHIQACFLKGYIPHYKSISFPFNSPNQMNFFTVILPLTNRHSWPCEAVDAAVPCDTVTEGLEDLLGLNQGYALES